MIYTEYDPLEEVIVADCCLPGDLDHFMPEKSLRLFNRILEETKEDFDKMAEFLKSGNIKVHRPDVLKFDSKISLPNFQVNLPMPPVVPRDQYKVQGKTILQTYTSLTDRYYDGLSYYRIFKELFDQGYNWISQPSPVLKDLDISNMWYINDKVYKENFDDKILWHTATMFPAGDTIILNSKGPGSDSGYEWIKRNLPEFKFIENENTCFENYGHIDHGFLLIDDETIIHAGIEWIPECLRKKRLIDVSSFLPQTNLESYKQDIIDTGGKYQFDWLEKYLKNWRGYNQKVCFDLNVLILDRNNILFAREVPELFRYLKKFGIDCHVSKQRHVLYWEGGIHCSTLDIKRKGEIRKII
jgi:N-dimethylarginine dimethylaminohydrolase